MVLSLLRSNLVPNKIDLGINDGVVTLDDRTIKLIAGGGSCLNNNLLN